VDNNNRCVDPRGLRADHRVGNCQIIYRREVLRATRAVITLPARARAPSFRAEDGNYVCALVGGRSIRNYTRNWRIC